MSQLWEEALKTTSSLFKKGANLNYSPQWLYNRNECESNKNVKAMIGTSQANH
jgi:hypothetical protein